MSILIIVGAVVLGLIIGGVAVYAWFAKQIQDAIGRRF